MSYLENMFSKSYMKKEKTYVDDGRKTVMDCLRYYAECFGDKEAVVFASYSGDRQVVTWIELLNKSIAVAKSLIQLGVKPGEFVAVNLRCCPHWLYVAFGSMFAGVCVASISFTYKDGSDLVATMEKIAKCSMLVMDPGENGDNWNIVKPMIDKFSSNGLVTSKKLPYLRYIVGYEDSKETIMTGVKMLDDLVNSKHPDISLPEITKDSLAMLVQTSGSTGVPKLVTLTQRNIMFLHQITTNAEGFLEQKNVQFNDRPFTWTGGFPWSVIYGQKRVTINGFEPVPKDRVAGIIDIVTREKCNFLVALPPMLHALIKRKDDLPKDWPMPSILTGGQPLTREISKAVGTIAKSLVQAYGGTEFFFLSNGISYKRDFKEFWCGKVFDGPAMEVKVVDENEDVVPVNTKGEIYVKSEGVFHCYLNDPVKTTAAKTPDGWYKTDDIGLMTETGDLYVYGRKSNMIISGGMNVAPEILEHSIKFCPGISTAVIVPIPDEVYYQVLCACLIRKDGSDVTEDQVRAFCEDMHNDKPGMFTVLPTYYVFLTHFPETVTGKTSRPALKELAEGLIEKSTK